MIDDGFCKAAAALGETGWLAYAKSHGHAWTTDTSHSAFINCQFETLAWLRLQQPPCPWNGIWEPSRFYRVNFPKMPPGGSTSNAQLQEVLKRLLEHAASPCTTRTTQDFLQALLSEVLDGMLSRHGLLKDVVMTVAAAGSVATMDRLWQRYHGEIGRHGSVCTEASRAGNVPMLEYLLGQPEFDVTRDMWDLKSCIEAACQHGQLAMLSWFQSHGYADIAACRYAAGSGNIGLLAWLRGCDPPWPWGAEVYAAAADEPRALHWLLTQDPPCPCHYDHGHPCEWAWLGSLARLGDIAMIGRLNLPVHIMPQLCIVAAQTRNLALLKWLVQQQPPCPLTPKVCWIAANDAWRQEAGMLRFLLQENSPPTYPRRGKLARISSWCRPVAFLMLAQAGCPMRAADQSRVTALVEAWYVFMGLWHWASRRMQEMPALVNTPNQQQSDQAPSALLVQFARLPYELAESIAADALLNPQQASFISFKSDMSCSCSDYSESELDEMYRDEDVDSEDNTSSSDWDADLFEDWP